MRKPDRSLRRTFLIPLSLAVAMSGMLVALLPSGCTTVKDVSNDPAYLKGFRQGDLYLLRSRAVLLREPSAATYQLTLDSALVRDSYRGFIFCSFVEPGEKFYIDHIVHTTIVAPVQGESNVKAWIKFRGRGFACSGAELEWELTGKLVATTPGGWPTMFETSDSPHIARVSSPN